jgi:hypothetical protein
MLDILKIVLGSICVIYALMQYRLTLVYLNILRSAVVPTGADSPALIHASLSAALAYSLYATFLFIINWPKVVTYILAVLLLKSLVDLALAFMAIGRFGVPNLTPKGRRYHALSEIVPVVFYLLFTAGSALWLGY